MKTPDHPVFLHGGELCQPGCGKLTQRHWHIGAGDTNTAEFEALAIELATNPTKLKAIKDKLERNRLTTPLFDTPEFTKHIESAYTKMYERYQEDLAPDHIYIEATALAATLLK